MGKLTLTNLDDELLKRLTILADLHGVSLEEEAKKLLEQSVMRRKTSREDMIKRINEFRKRIGPQKTDSVDLIREDRDNR